MIAVIGMTEVLLARIVSARDMALDLREQLLLERQVFEHRFDDIVGIAHGFAEVGFRRNAIDRGRVVAEIFQIRGDARFHRVEVLGKSVGDGYVVSGKREDLRNAVPHQAGADDCNLRLLRFDRHDQPAV